MISDVLMQKLQVIAGRYELKELVGTGGMGSVYRARDLQSGQLVAVKILPESADDGRFVREARILATLSDPGIVRYLAHGVGESGHAYMVMEWLDGEDLSRRLARQPLQRHEALVVLRQTALALRAAHDRGIVHRDIKPSNLFLVDRTIENLRVLDFGIARDVRSVTRAMTGTGMVVGTVEYMAPEQARGERDITPASDIFSLGCTVYECLAGKSPFAGQHFAAVLAKILFEVPLGLSRIYPDFPVELDALLSAMLAKIPSDRIADATALLRRVEALPSHVWQTQDAPSRSTEKSAQRSLLALGSEQGIVTVLLVTSFNAQAVAHVDTEHVAADAATQVRSDLDLALSQVGAVAEPLIDGSMVVRMRAPHGSEITDQAARAAQCALLIRKHRPRDSIAIATGKGALHDALPLGEALARAGDLLRNAHEAKADSALIFLDETTAALLDSRFAVRAISETYVLEGTVSAADLTRPLLGKPTPCVGRESELSMLRGTASACVDDSSSQAVVVIAPAGAGKSRLRHEFLRRLEQDDLGFRTLLGRAEPAETSTAPFLIAQLLRRLMSRGPEGSTEWSVAAIQTYLEGLELPNPEEQSELLAALCRLPINREPSPKMMAARRDPRILAEHWEWAILALLRAECARQPLLLVLEDLQWADSVTVKLIGTALSQLRESPLMVLALARPDVNQRFPSLWTRITLELPLRPLSKRACEQLVTAVLGRNADSALTRRIVEQSGGNPLFLEELLRAAASGKTTELPDSIVAMLQVRVTQLDAELRRLLLAASVLGNSFSASEVAATLDLPSHDDVLQLLTHACQTELLRKTISDSNSEGEYRFVQSQLRDATYALLADHERQQLHERALVFLQKNPNTPPTTLAEHAERAKEPALALRYWIQAAELALRTSNLDEAMRTADRALALSPTGEQRGAILGIQLLAQVWSRKWERVGILGKEALDLLPAGSSMWCRIAGPLGMAELMGGQTNITISMAERLCDTTPDVEALPDYVESMSLLLGTLSLRCFRAVAEKISTKLLQVAVDVDQNEALTHGWVALSHSEYLRHTEPTPYELIHMVESGAGLLIAAGHKRTQIFAQNLWGQVLGECGEYAQGEQVLRASVNAALSLGESYAEVQSKLHLAALLASNHDPSSQKEALQMVQQLPASGELNPSFRGWAQAIAANVHLTMGLPDEAVVFATDAIAYSGVVPLRQLLARATLISGLLAQGNHDQAKSEAELALQKLDELGTGGYAEAAVVLAVVQVLLSTQDIDRAKTRLSAFISKLETRSHSLPNRDARERYLRSVFVHARLLELAESLGIPFQIERRPRKSTLTVRP